MKFNTIVLAAIIFQAAFVVPSLGAPASTNDSLNERSTEHNQPHPVKPDHQNYPDNPSHLKPVWNPPHRVQSVPHEGVQYYRRGGWWGDNDWEDDRYGYGRGYDDDYNWRHKNRGHGYRKNRWWDDRWGYRGGRRYGGGYGWDYDRGYGYGRGW
ncbi:hypothetical protein E4T56_gene18816 [Termitomyces sp. T112]|nr:hypothetical protein E4T56_gene18816 [Termitomyces sp. T112]